MKQCISIFFLEIFCPNFEISRQEALSDDFVLYQETNGSTYVPPPPGGYEAPLCCRGRLGLIQDAMSANKNHQRRTDLKAGEF